MLSTDVFEFFFNYVINKALFCKAPLKSAYHKDALKITLYYVYILHCSRDIGRLNEQMQFVCSSQLTTVDAELGQDNYVI